MHASLWLDGLKTLIGAFAGAGLAFASNLWFQRRERLRTRKAAGNLALAMIGLQWSDFIIVRKGFEERRREVLAQSPNAPLWLQAWPTHFYFSDGLKFDFKSLAFLFEHHRAELFSKLALCEQRYYDLASLIARYSEAAELLQAKLAAAGIRDGVDFTVGQAEAAIGADILGKVRTLLQGVWLRLEEDESTYRNAAEDLR